MKNNASFDDHIKKQFSNYEPGVPEHLWKKIIAEKENKKPRGFLFFLTGNRLLLILTVCTLCTAGGLLIPNIYKNNLQDKIAIPVTNSKYNNSTGNKTFQTPTVITSVNAKVGNEQDKNDGESKPVISKNSPNAPARDELIFTPKTGKTLTENNKSRRLTPGSMINERKEDENKTYAESENLNIVTAKSFSTRKGNKLNKTMGKSQVTVENGVREDMAVDLESTYKSSQTIQSKQEKLFRNDLWYLSTLYLDKTFPLNIKNINRPLLSIPCPRVGQPGAGKKYLEIYGGPDYAFRNFSDTANSVYLNKRKESTQFTSAFSFGLRYTKVFNNAISFRTGINYSQVNEKFMFQQGNIIQQVYVTDGNGDTTGSYGTSTNRYKSTHNRSRTLDIPLLIGYEMGNGKLHTNVNAGLVINAYSWQKGDVLDTTYQPVNITTGRSNSVYQFKTNTGIGFMAAATFYYKLTGRMQILGEPYFRYNFSAANKAALTFKQKYTTTGIRLGLRINL